MAFAQRWAYHASRSGGRTDSAVATAAVVLVENAHAHTRSGLPGGTVTVVLNRGPFLLALEVTDEGPRPGQTRYPLPHARPDRTGLRLVERLTVYWDWEGSGGGPLTVRAMFERP
ncbi:ATP-binding protein [Nocardiopsis sp. ARC36]